MKMEITQHQLGTAHTLLVDRPGWTLISASSRGDGVLAIWATEIGDAEGPQAALLDIAKRLGHLADLVARMIPAETPGASAPPGGHR